jgi:Kef-type K+ transport system membrane component KefB
VVTSFLLLGLVVGPEGLDLMSFSVINSLRIIEPIALGMITFAAGEQLHFVDIRVLSRRHFVAIALETILPVILVATGAWFLTGSLEIALPVGAIAGTTGLATVMSTLKEKGATGTYPKLLGFAISMDNFFAILAFSLILPLVVVMETGGDIGGLYVEQLLGMAASVAIGCVAGFVVSRLIRSIRSSHELSMFVLAHVLLVVGVTYYLDFSVLLAGLAMGATAVNMTSDIRDRDRAFAALRTLEFPVIAMFFLWAGASLHIRALGTIGLLFGVYVVARAVGKVAGPLATAWKVRANQAESRRFVGLGFSLLPQAGAAVGLATLARDNLPASGQTILATVLAAVVVFELVGPLGVQWGIRHVGESAGQSEGHPLTLEEAIKELQTRKARMVAVVDSRSEPSILEVPRLLAARFTADLTIVPVCAGASPGMGWWMPDESVECGPLGLDVEPEVSDGRTTEVMHAPVIASEGTLDALLAVLVEESPDILLVSPAGQSGWLLMAAGELGRRLGCPVLEIPAVPSGEVERRDLGTRATAALEGLTGLWRRARSELRRAGLPLPGSDGETVGPEVARPQVSKNGNTGEAQREPTPSEPALPEPAPSEGTKPEGAPAETPPPDGAREATPETPPGDGRRDEGQSEESS